MRVKVNQAAFEREKKRLDELLRQVSQHAYVAAKQSADEYTDLVKTGIGVTSPPSFAPNWDPLSLAWKMTKKGHNEEFWAETMGIFRAIETKIISKSLKMIHLFAGIMQSKDPDAFERAMRNEYGYGWGPARPLFEPAKDFMAPMTGSGRRLRKKEIFKQALYSAIRRVYKK